MSNQLWNDLLAKEGIDARIDKAIEELEELQIELELLKNSITQKPNKECVDEIADVKNMIESLETIFKIKSKVEMRQLAKREKARIDFYKSHRNFVFDKKKLTKKEL